MRRLRSWRTVAAVGIVAGVLLGLSLLEGDVAEDLTHFASLVAGLLNRFGAAASFALLYIEESGVPLPVPGDVYVAYLGKLKFIVGFKLAAGVARDCGCGGRRIDQSVSGL